MEKIYKDGVLYRLHNFEKEADFEKIVFKLKDAIFGKDVILFDKKKLKSEAKIGTIPDAFILSPSRLTWTIVEVELKQHDVYNHIVPQVSKFKSVLNNPGAKKKLISYFKKSIETDNWNLAKWKDNHEDNKIFENISTIVDNDPDLVIIIDGDSPTLMEALQTLPFQTKIFCLKTFVRKDFSYGDNVFLLSSDFEFSDENANDNRKKTYTNKVEVGFVHGSKQKQRSASPSAETWLNSIPELRNVKGLTKWSHICKHLNIETNISSARIVLSRWVKKNRPNWTDVPDA